MCVFLSIFNEEYPPITEENALAKWASDPANTAWMESKIGDANALLILMEKMQLLVLCTFPRAERLPSGPFPGASFFGHLRKQALHKLFLQNITFSLCLTKLCMLKIMHSLM